MSTEDTMIGISYFHIFTFIEKKFHSPVSSGNLDTISFSTLGNYRWIHKTDICWHFSVTRQKTSKKHSKHVSTITNVFKLYIYIYIYIYIYREREREGGMGEREREREREGKSFTSLLVSLLVRQFSKSTFFFFLFFLIYWSEIENVRCD